MGRSATRRVSSAWVVASVCVVASACALATFAKAEAGAAVPSAAPAGVATRRWPEVMPPHAGFRVFLPGGGAALEVDAPVEAFEGALVDVDESSLAVNVAGGEGADEQVPVRIDARAWRAPDASGAAACRDGALAKALPAEVRAALRLSGSDDVAHASSADGAVGSAVRYAFWDAGDTCFGAAVLAEPGPRSAAIVARVAERSLRLRREYEPEPLDWLPYSAIGSLESEAALLPLRAALAADEKKHQLDRRTWGEAAWSLVAALEVGGHEEAATAALEEALAVDPDAPPLLLARARRASDAGRKEAAVADTLRAIEQSAAQGSEVPTVEELLEDVLPEHAADAELVAKLRLAREKALKK